jgi:putative methionine-R-sulfoxide reductase with GAF domain
MKYLSTFGFRQRMHLFVFVLILLLFTIAGVTVFFAQKNRILNSANESATQHLNDLYSILEISSVQYNHLDIGGKAYQVLKPVFSDRTYFGSAEVYLIDLEGKYLIHPTDENKPGSGENANQLMLRTRLPSGVLEFRNAEGKGYYQHYRFFEPYQAYLVITFQKDQLLEALSKSRNMLVMLVILFSAVSLFSLNLILKPIGKNLTSIRNSLRLLSEGELTEKLESSSKDELGQIINSFNKLVEGMRETAEFASEIGMGNLDKELHLRSDRDVLGLSMQKMRDELRSAAWEEGKRKKEDAERKWIAEGLARFADVLRTNYQSPSELGDHVIKSLVKYLDVNQGGMFLVNDEDENPRSLDLLSAFAFDRKKYLTRKILFGEGLIGACAMEKQTIYLTEIPQGYISITSGLGDANPDSLLIVPMKMEETLFGVIELASFRKLEAYEIEFVEKVAQNVASTISVVKINARTSALLNQSQQQAEEMAAQEEEMRQNMEELQATQEESARREAELMGFMNTLDKHFLRAEFSEEGKLLHANGIFESRLGGINITQLEDLFHLIHEKNSSSADSMKEGKNFQGIFSIQQGETNVWLYGVITPLSGETEHNGKRLFLAVDLSDTELRTGSPGIGSDEFNTLRKQWQKMTRSKKS